jgi:uncharacterized protein (DUF427 family)
MSGPEITIEPAKGTWNVRAQGAIIGETTNALLLREGGLPPVLYIPRADLQMVFFDRSTHLTTCPLKGQANYFHLVGKNRTIENIAWSYEEPLSAVAQITGHLAFYHGDVTIEKVS